MTMSIKVQINGQKFKQSKMCVIFAYSFMCMCNVLDHFHHLDLSEKMYFKKLMVEEIG